MSNLHNKVYISATPRPHPPRPPPRTLLKFIYVWAECPGRFDCQDDLEELENDAQQMWAWHSCTILLPPRKHGRHCCAGSALPLSENWIMSFQTICPQASLKIHEWAILWGTGAIVCPRRPGAEDLTWNSWRGASVAISQADLAEAPASAGWGFWGNSATLQHVSPVPVTWWGLCRTSMHPSSQGRAAMWLMGADRSSAASRYSRIHVLLQVFDLQSV